MKRQTILSIVISAIIVIDSAEPVMAYTLL